MAIVYGIRYRSKNVPFRARWSIRPFVCTVHAKTVRRINTIIVADAVNVDEPSCDDNSYTRRTHAGGVQYRAKERDDAFRPRARFGGVFGGDANLFCSVCGRPTRTLSRTPRRSALPFAPELSAPETILITNVRAKISSTPDHAMFSNLTRSFTLTRTRLCNSKWKHQFYYRFIFLNLASLWFCCCWESYFDSVFSRLLEHVQDASIAIRVFNLTKEYKNIILNYVV